MTSTKLLSVYLLLIQVHVQVPVHERVMSCAQHMAFMYVRDVGNLHVLAQETEG